MKDLKLTTEFYCDGVVISRYDYESMLSGMYAMEFDDNKMLELVKRISNALSSHYGYTEQYINSLEDDSKEKEKYYNVFWQVMENIAIDMGMRYYEDMTDEEYSKIMNESFV